jgi:hypothetical protein
MAIVTIEIDERVATALRAQAEADHLPLTAFLERIAGISVLPLPSLPITEEEWNQMFDEVSCDSPKSHLTFSRADIYFDHD